jgi:hypothetical protein
MKVIVFDMGLSSGIVAEGETDGKIVEQRYLRVNGELYNAVCVIQDTSEARCALDIVVKTNKAAENAKTFAHMLGARLITQFNVVKLP